MNKIIAFCGAKGSGKTTASNLLQQKINEKICIEIAFADKLKNTCSKVFGIDSKHFYTPSLKDQELEEYVCLGILHIEEIYKEFGVTEYDKSLNVRPFINKYLYTPREVLQYVGTEILQKVDPLIHSKATFNDIDKEEIVIISDLRFPQELDFINSLTLYEVFPVYINNFDAEFRSEMDGHYSETAFRKMVPSCYKIDNNSSMNHLKKQIEELYKQLRLGEDHYATIRES